MVIERRVNGMDELIQAISQGGNDPEEKGPVIVKLCLWDDRMVTAKYHKYKGYEVPDVKWYCGNVIGDYELIRPFATRLVHDGQPFVTDTGSAEEEMVCVLKWEIC